MPQATRARGKPVYPLPVNPYTHTRALSPFEVPCGALGGPHKEEDMRRLPYACYHALSFLLSYVLYVCSKGG